MRLVEELWKLHAEWSARIAFRKKRSYVIDDPVTDRLQTCVDGLTPLIALAEAQEKELAHWKWLYGDRSESKQQNPPEQSQHSADLREVAELASLAGKTYGQQSERYINGEVANQPDWPTPDSILSAWRERKAENEQQKSKEGDARESGSSS